MTTTVRPPLLDLGPAEVITAISLIRTGEVYDLEVGRWPGMPIWPGHPPFQILAYRTPRGINIEHDQDWRGRNGRGWAWQSELLQGTVHTGTHVDALAHCCIGPDNHWFGGVSADERAGDFGPLEGDATEIPPIVTRGVLVDVAAAKGVPALEAHYAIGPQDLMDALKRQGTELRRGDVALIRTGYLGFWPNADGMGKYRESGINLAAGEYLLQRGVVAVAADTESVEVQPSRDPDDPQPIHRRLLNENGVYLIELVDCEQLSQRCVYEFCFVALPLKIRYATGSMLRPVAIV